MRSDVFRAGGAAQEPPALVAFARVRAQPQRRRLALAVLVVLALGAGAAGAVVGAGQGDDEEGVSSVPTPGRATPEERISFLAKIVPPPARAEAGGRSVFPARVAALAKRMSTERRAAQLFVFGFRGTDATAEIFGRLRRLDLGGIAVSSSNYVEQGQLSALAGEAAAVAKESRHVPPWVFASQEGGDLNAFPDLPPSAAPADLRSAGAAADEARSSASSLRQLGVNAVLGPVIDVGTETGSALGARVYSDDPEQVSAYAKATVGAYRAERVFSAARHFPGLGAADQSTQDGPATVGLGLDELRQRDLIPFEAAVDAGVPGITIGSALYPFSDFTVPASLSRLVDSQLLRREFRFKGVAMTDDLADPAISTLHTVPDAAVKALQAGADMLYISGSVGDQQAAYIAVLRAVRRGRLPRRRLDEAVGRILLAKQDYNLIR
jgi:beta-N-acetylhexosaminidase